MTTTPESWEQQLHDAALTEIGPELERLRAELARTDRQISIIKAFYQRRTSSLRDRAERAEAEVERLRGQLSLNRPTITDHEES